MNLFQTNFFAAVGVCQLVVPHFRARGAGTVVNISSIGRRIELPFQGLYSASKFALEGLTEALRMEVKPFGVHVVLVEPGDMRTSVTAQRRLVVGGEGDPHRERFARALRQVERDEAEGGDPAAWRGSSCASFAIPTRGSGRRWGDRFSVWLLARGGSSPGACSNGVSCATTV